MKALIIVDFQNDFITGSLMVPDAESIASKIVDYVRNLPSDIVAVVITMDSHTEEQYTDSPESEQFTVHCMKGTNGWKLHPLLEEALKTVDVPMFTVYKDVFSMWERDIEVVGSDGVTYIRDQLIRQLRFLNVDTVSVIGLAGNVCVKQAAVGFHENEFNVEVIDSMIKSIDIGNGEQDTNLTFVFADQIAKGDFKVIY